MIPPIDHIAINLGIVAAHDATTPTQDARQGSSEDNGGAVGRARGFS